MNEYEIVLFILIGIWLILLTIGFSFILGDMLDRTKKLKDTLTELYSYINDDLDPQIKRIRQLVNVLLNDKKEDTSISKTDHDEIYSDTDIIKSVKFSYTPEERYVIHEPSYDVPSYGHPEVKDVCVIVETNENGRPYYSIRYVTDDNVCHVGYGSYKLKTVLMYFKDYFECKEDTGTNSKVSQGHVFELKKVSDTCTIFNEQIEVHTVDDLKSIWDKYGHSTKLSGFNDFDHNRLIIDFDKNRIIIYDGWVE